jgi:hypothetical protein
MSDLLNKASLVVIPSGYKEDTVYSVVPSDGSGDLSFTRASNGTRVNSAGLVEVCPWNLAQQSETFDNASWEKKTGGTSMVTVTANSGIAPNGTTTADRIQLTRDSLGFAQVIQTVTTTTSQSYTFSVYLKSLSGTPTVMFGSFGGTNTQTATLTNEWVRYTWTATSPSTSAFALLMIWGGVGSTSLSADFLAWGYQLVEGSSAKPYFPTTDRLNVPRLTYQNGGGGCPSLLLEPQSTNLVVQSNDMTTWTNGGGTMTKNATTSPDGTNNALSFNNTSDCSTFVAASNGVYSWSLFVKQGTSASAAIDMSDGATGDVYTNFVFATKTFSGTSQSGSWSTPSASYIDLGNGWYRITLTATKNAGSSIGHKIIASGSGYTYVYGAQLEASSYPTSYIPTTTASATRVADACGKTGISSLIGQTEGTLYYELQRNNTDNDSRLQISDGSTNNWFFVSIESGLVPRLYCVVGGTLQFSVYGSSVDNGFHKVAVAYKNNDFKVYIDGVASITQTSGSVPNCSQLDIGNSSPNGAVVSPSQIKEVVVFKTRLTNAELASLTTI